jgi:hypothetical protein
MTARGEYHATKSLCCKEARIYLWKSLVESNQHGASDIQASIKAGGLQCRGLITTELAIHKVNLHRFSTPQYCLLNHIKSVPVKPQ